MSDPVDDPEGAGPADADRLRTDGGSEDGSDDGATNESDDGDEEWKEGWGPIDEEDEGDPSDPADDDGGDADDEPSDADPDEADDTAADDADDEDDDSTHPRADDPDYKPYPRGDPSQGASGGMSAPPRVDSEDDDDDDPSFAAPGGEYGGSERQTDAEPEAADRAPDDAARAPDRDAARAPDRDAESNRTIGDSVGNAVSSFSSATAPDDQELPLTQHVEEMATRFLAVALVMVGVGGVALFYADDLINFLWYSFLGPGIETCLNDNYQVLTGPCPDAVRPRVYNPLSLVLARLKVGTLVGLVVALPVAVYQTYRFMRPGLYPRERRYYLAAVPTSLVLAAVGLVFAYFLVLPTLLSYFAGYSRNAADSLAFGLTPTLNLIITMLGFFAIVFQIPLLVLLAVMMGVTSRSWMEDRRLYFWGGFGAVAFLFSPDPTGMAPLMVAVTMIGLFEGTLLLLRWTSSDSPLLDPNAVAARRAYAWLIAFASGYVVTAFPLPGSYYSYFPASVRQTLGDAGYDVWVPIIVAGILIAVFEYAAYVLRQGGGTELRLRARLLVDRIRAPVWLAALVVGYFGSPTPPLLAVARDVGAPPLVGLFVLVILGVGFELFVLALRWRRGQWLG